LSQGPLGPTTQGAWRVAAQLCRAAGIVRISSTSQTDIVPGGSGLSLRRVAQGGRALPDVIASQAGTTTWLYRVVVIGGGVVGASVLYHLAKFGWTDVCLLERSVLTAGSSWHAAGGIHALNADPNMAALQAYTIDLLSEIQEESGQDIGLHMTGGLTMAGTPDRWEWLQSAYRVFQSIGIEDCRLVTPEEAGELARSCRPRVSWAACGPTARAISTPPAPCTPMPRPPRSAARPYFEHTKVEALNRRPTAGVVTDKGTITCEHVVNAAGLWAKQVGRMAGIELPSRRSSTIT
jgi:dimethylglycine dehydrogenase